MANFLDRETALAQTRNIRGLGAPILLALTDWGAEIFERCSGTAPNGEEDLGILMPLHHLVEMLDGIEVLLDHSCVIASRTPLRSAFEASLTIRYVLEDDTRRRSLSYVVGSVREEIRRLDEADPRSQAGKRFREDMGLREDSDFPFTPPERCRSNIEGLQELLAEDRFREISEEYDNASRRAKWYSLFGGPSNLRELSTRLGQLDDFLVLYRTWSATAHAEDLWRQVTVGKDGKAAVGVIRSPMGLPAAYHLACSIGTEAMLPVLQHYRPGEVPRFGAWFLKSVSPAMDELAAIKEKQA